MYKKIILNLVLLVTTYVVPLFVLYNNHNNYGDIVFRIQNTVFIVFFLGSAFLTYLNNKYRKHAKDHKWLWTIFEIIGILGLCCSGFILWLLFSFRNCCDIL